MENRIFKKIQVSGVSSANSRYPRLFILQRAHHHGTLHSQSAPSEPLHRPPIVWSLQCRTCHSVARSNVLLRSTRTKIRVLILVLILVIFLRDLCGQRVYSLAATTSARAYHHHGPQFCSTALTLPISAGTQNQAELLQHLRCLARLMEHIPRCGL
jgi:hypothetical protein